MYTLEDDHETSSRYKRDIANGAPQAGTFGGSTDAGGADQQGPTGTMSLQGESGHDKSGHGTSVPTGRQKGLHLSPQQITGSMQALARPGASNRGGQKVALAALTIACISVFFTALDQTVVVTALTPIIKDLNIPIMQLDHAAWIVSAYLLGFVVVMPLMGRVSDIYGRRRIFLLCLSIFGIGSLLCGLSPWLAANIDISFLATLHVDVSNPGLAWLIGARFLQAIGGGAVVPVAMAIAGDFYGQERRALAIGIVGAVTEAGGALGPLYGALVVEHFNGFFGMSGWTWIFFLNIPIVMALFIGASLLIPRGTRLREGIDWIGAILLGLALTCLSLGLAQQGASFGPAIKNASAPQNNPVALILAVVFLLVFILFELRIPRALFKREARWPLIDLKLFKRFPFSAASLVSLLVGAGLIIAMADIPIFVETVMGGTVLDSGLALLRMTVMIPIGAVLGGWLCSRISCRVTGVIGLLFTAVGFFMMSRWPMHVDWNQITLSALTTGFGFGLVVAPIGTTAINAVKATQAGVGSAIVTALRMVGMILGLAALTSWALAYFRELAAQYTSPDLTGYAAYLIQAAHTVYNAVFFAAMVLSLIAIIPAVFLWGRSAPVGEVDAAVLAQNGSPVLPDAVTLAGDDEDTLTRIPTASLQTQAGLPPIPPEDTSGGQGGKGGRDPRRRRTIIAIASVALVLLLVGGGVLAAVLLTPGSSPSPSQTGTGPGGAPAAGSTATPVSGPRMLEVALDKTALTSIFVSQLNIQQGPLTDMYLVPAPNDGLVMGMNLHIDANGIHRVMPIELDAGVGVDAQQNLMLKVYKLKRDGIDAGASAAASMQSALNQLLASTLMPALRSHLGKAQLVSVHTSSSVACGKGAEMFVMLIKAPPIEGIAAQPTPVPFCFSGNVDLNKLLPS